MSEWIAAETPAGWRPGSRWVKALAHIRRNATGEVRRYETTDVLEDGQDTPSDYAWTDGNYGCDCNRSLFFERAGGEVPDETVCGEEAYCVNLENPATGEIYYREFD